MLTVWGIVPAVSSLGLKTDLALRLCLDKERQGQVAAEQQAAVLAGTLEAANERLNKAQAATIEVLSLARKKDEAVFLDAAKVWTGKTPAPIGPASWKPGRPGMNGRRMRLMPTAMG